MNHGVRFMKYYTGAGTIKQTAWQRRYNDSDSARTDRHQTRLPSDHHLQDDANTNEDTTNKKKRNKDTRELTNIVINAVQKLVRSVLVPGKSNCC